jgi:16S rRNA G966 N2-methylase RsmD
MTRTGVRQSGGGNRLYFGDNLTVLREHVKDESVDLIYLDPPFNSDANYNVLFRSPTGQESDGNGRIAREMPMQM